MSDPAVATDSDEGPPSPLTFSGGSGTQSVRIRDALVAVLAFTSGFLDALCLLRFGVFASVMTGNTVILGLAIAGVEPLSALRSGLAIAAYMGGAAVATVVADSAPESQGRIWPPGATNAFMVEFLALLALAVGGAYLGSGSVSDLVYVLVALAAMSMGMQSVAVNALGISGISTTYITGTYTSFVINLLRWRRSSSSENSVKKKSDAARQATVVIVYVLAAIVGGLAETHLSLDAALVPVAVLGMVIVVAKTRMR